MLILAIFATVSVSINARSVSLEFADWFLRSTVLANLGTYTLVISDGLFTYQSLTCGTYGRLHFYILSLNQSNELPSLIVHRVFRDFFLQSEVLHDHWSKLTFLFYKPFKIFFRNHTKKFTFVLPERHD